MDLFDLHSSSKMPTKTYKRKRHFTDAYSSDPRQSSPAALDDDALITRSNMKRRMLKRAKLTDTKENENKASTSGSKLPVYPPISRRAAPSTARAASQHLKENRPWRALASPFHSRRSSRASPISSPAPRKDTKSNQQHRKRSTSLKRTHSSQINPFPAAITPNSVQTHSSGVQPQYPFRRVDHDEWLARVSRSPFAPGTPLRSPSLDYAQSTPARLYARKNSADDFHNAFGLYDSFMPPTDRDLEDIIMRESDTFVAEQGTIYSDSPSATMTSTQPAQTSPANLQNLTARSNFETSSPFSAHVPAIEYVIELRGATTSPAPRTSEAPQPFRNRNRQSIANRPLVLNLPTSSPQFNNIQPSPSFSRHGSGRPHLPAPALDEALLSLKLVGTFCVISAIITSVSRLCALLPLFGLPLIALLFMTVLPPISGADR